ncbi:hypothetical protein [Sulfuriroseicoccus oceanibius]|uniref:Uncharacterized protein n=1 Tax=Sulfuriroseicoccus oceanibius TaxID=2707525 RepID=A0A6B3L4T8_9BACT|nr:hypothetical protein [Sulfuriroseicoccus oceanibius]QQL43975.1 hypothetical protein G3M56_008710 [Sulfuriroseicoccus oceanibius]
MRADVAELTTPQVLEYIDALAVEQLPVWQACFEGYEGGAPAGVTGLQNVVFETLVFETYHSGELPDGFSDSVDDMVLRKTVDRELVEQTARFLLEQRSEMKGGGAWFYPDRTNLLRIYDLNTLTLIGSSYLRRPQVDAASDRLRKGQAEAMVLMVDPSDAQKGFRVLYHPAAGDLKLDGMADSLDAVLENEDGGASVSLIFLTADGLKQMEAGEEE